MTDKKRTAEGAGALSRRDAIIGALALAAGTLVASKPDVALAASGDPILMAMDNECTGQTQIIRNSPSGGPASSIATLNHSGENDAQFGVFGVVTSSANTASAGVWGQSMLPLQAGVLARSDVLDGIGLKASASAGTGLQVEGKVNLKRSGRGSIAKGSSKTTVTVPMPLGIETGALILVTLQGSAGTGVYLSYAKRTSGTTFQVVLNKAATVKVYFAWMLLN